MFFFNRKKKEPKRLAKAQPTATQKRSSFRMPVQFDVSFILRGRPGRRHAVANDLSAGGLRLMSDEDFLRGSVLELDFVLPGDFLEEMSVEKEVYEQTPFGLRPETMKVQPPPFHPMRMNATVLSTFFVPNEKALAHGMQFVEVEPAMQEELQRFIHLWQLHYLRSRHSI
ncbi:MAG: PilZ domain-containing protein [Vulcanimicrobiaceae bacterium]